MKVLKLVNKLESDGYRINLNIALVATNNSYAKNPKMVSLVVKIKDASQNNLKNLDVTIPLGVFTCVTGVSGSR